MKTEATDHWFTVRLLFEISVGDESDRNGRSRFEDRFILVRGEDESDACLKGASFAEQDGGQYVNADGERVQWTFKQAVDAHQIVESTLREGTELYSAFIDPDFAGSLMRGGDSPVKAWLRQNPGANPGTATVGELLEAWDKLDNEEWN